MEGAGGKRAGGEMEAGLGKVEGGPGEVEGVSGRWMGPWGGEGGGCVRVCAGFNIAS